MKPVSIYQQGYRLGLLYKEGRKYDYVVTLDYPVKRTRIKKGDYQARYFNIQDFLKKLAYRINANWYTKYISREILDLLPINMRNNSERY